MVEAYLLQQRGPERQDAPSDRTFARGSVPERVPTLLDQLQLLARD